MPANVPGSRNCRTRRKKCDEQRPCGYCIQKGLECKQTEFIVHIGPSQIGSRRKSKRLAFDETHPSSVTYEPGSLYSVFRQPSPVPVPDPGPAIIPKTPPEIAITEEIALLLDHYQTGIGMWQDIFDNSHSYQIQVVQQALCSPLLLHTICALSAKQKSLTSETFIWEPIANRHYGESVTLIIQGLSKEPTSREGLVTATILLCSYELLANPGIDYQRHFYGFRSLFQTYDVSRNGTELELAGFWIFARQDISWAIAHESPTSIPPHQWPGVPRSNDKKEDSLGKRMLWFLAKVMEFRFSTESTWTAKQTRTFKEISNEVDLWWENLPDASRGMRLTSTEPREEEVARTWFYCSAAGE